MFSSDSAKSVPTAHRDLAEAGNRVETGPVPRAGTYYFSRGEGLQQVSREEGPCTSPLRIAFRDNRKSK